MGLSLRLLVLDQGNRIYRVSVADFDDMRRNPATNRYPQFAAQRIRGVEAVVELVNRKAVRVVRLTFDILTFDQFGCFDSETFDRHQFSRFEAAMAPDSSTLATDLDLGVVDASSRFAARGGSWVPSQALASAIRDAALGRSKCPRLG